MYWDANNLYRRAMSCGWFQIEKRQFWIQKKFIEKYDKQASLSGHVTTLE